jgi:hypothetical protein
MVEAERDENREPTLIGVSDVNLEIPAKVAVNPDSDGAGTPGVVVEVAD